MFSGYKKALKTKQKTIAAFVWGQQSKCKFLSQASLQRYRRNFCKEQNIKAHHRMTLPTKRNPANVLMIVGFLYLFLRQGASFIDSWVDATCASFEDRLDFYFDCSPLQVITNISSHITQPVKRFSHYVMMCLFGQLHIGEKSILTYVFLKGSMSSVKSCGLVYFVKCKLHVLFAIELKKSLWTTKSQLLVQQICLVRII